MRVVHLLSSSHFHGAEAAVLELCKRQVEEGLDISVLLLRNNNDTTAEIESRFEQAGIKLSSIPVRGRWNWGAANRLRRRIKEGAVDILHSHKYKTTPYALFASLGRETRVVSTYHNWLDETRMLRVYMHIDKHLARYCDACVAVSGPVAQELLRFTQAEKVHLVHNGIDINRWKPSPGDGIHGDAVVGFVGRLSSAKGVGLLLEAVSDVPLVGGRPLRCLVVGDGELLEQLRERADRPDLRGRVTFTGAIDDVAAVYQEMDVICLPSENEGCPMVLIEAMASGVPATASNVGDVSKLIIDGETGLLLPERSTESIRRVISELLSDDSRRQAMGSAARQHIEREFAVQIMSSRYQRVYQSALKSPAVPKSRDTA
jgi:glycosyltransferase involved in cell wall biosynthesis